MLLAHTRATLLPPDAPEHAAGVAGLRERYPQYRAMALEERPLIALEPLSYSAWGPALDSARTPRTPGCSPDAGRIFCR